MSKKTPALMIQGTCSNAGKSLLTAALCRIFAQDGLSVAPFKAQNMALNSFVTLDGCEIGRAQALQAAAAGRDPHTHMNPVLLKPHSDMGSQVILLGKPVAHMKVSEYIKYKPIAWQEVTKAYDALSSTAQVMVIEGAGSPAEINLKAHDIVNMAMAKYAQAPVLLCADIDRGGAFASLVGTMALLDQEEKDLVAGFILNKFRGDARLLDTAFAPIEALTGKPFVGTVPWLKDLRLPEEDSVSFHLYGVDNTKKVALTENMLDVALVVTPHLSNISDLDALKVEPDVRLRLVRTAQDLIQEGRAPDMLLLLGTKNTAGDLEYLKESGLFAAIIQEQERIPCIVGICGGLQILGNRVTDPHGFESDSGMVKRGLDLLPIRTVMKQYKRLARSRFRYKGTLLAPHKEMFLEGYEIHHGFSVPWPQDSQVEPCLVSEEGHGIAWELCLPFEHGAGDKTRRIFGTYLHGIWDNNLFRRVFLDAVRKTKGLRPIKKITPYTLETELDRLADEVRKALDMDAIYKLIGR